MIYKTSLVSAALVVGAFAMTACTNGTTGGSVVQGLSLSTAQVNNDTTVSIQAQLDTGSVTMLPTAVSIINPKKPSQVLGQLSVLSSIAGGSGSWELQLTLDINQALAAAKSAGMATLPNGTTIPISGINAANWVSLPLGTANSELYLNVDSANKKAVVGVAMNIPSLTAGIAADALFPFAYNGVSGLAGIYTGASSGTSGLATFVDLSSVIQTSGAVSFYQHLRNVDAIPERVEHLQRTHARVHFTDF